MPPNPRKEAPSHGHGHQQKGPPRESTQHELCTLRGPQAPEQGKHCARGGTRTAFQPLQTLRTPENIPNPSQFGTGTDESAAQGVHNVHTLFCPLPCPVQPTRAPGWAREFTNSRLDGIDDESCWLSLSMFSSGMLMAVERFLKCCTCSTGTQGNFAMNKRKILLPA
jgi:hypothetical protein